MSVRTVPCSALLLLACQGEVHRTRTPDLAAAAGSTSAAPTASRAAGEVRNETRPSLAPPPLAPPRQGPAWPPAPPEGVITDFCIDTVHALDTDACYVLPERPTRELLLYLHGTIPPTGASVQKTNYQTIVMNASRRASVAALLPRGRRGLAPKSQAGWWGWPTTGESYLRLASELVRRFVEQRRQLEELTGRRFERLYVAGSSSGAYFTAALALNGEIQADGFGALSGGSLSFRETLATLPPRPFYVGYGLHDSVGGSAQKLADRLRKAGWPVQISAHPVGHGAKEVYLDEAFVFWRAAMGALD